jgi:signal transduction histidine kinase
MVAGTAAAVMSSVFNGSGVRAVHGADGDRYPSGRPHVSALPSRRWMERREIVALAGTVVLVIAFSVGRIDPGAGGGVALLYVVSIGLWALEFGLLAGGLAGALAFALWSLDVHSDVDAIGVLTLGFAYLALGLIAGWFGTRMRDGQARQRRLLQSGLTLAHLGTGDDLAAVLGREARKLFPACSVQATLSRGADGGADPVVHDPAQARIAVTLRGTSYGALTIGRARRLSPDDRATLEILALQAAVAAENRELLERAREHAVVRAELERARLSLDERADQLRHLIDRQEAERDHVARELREQAAQTLAAVLWALGALGRELTAEATTDIIGELRCDIGSTLRSLRALAADLRPPLELGLPAALERLADPARPTRFSEVAITPPVAERLDPEVQAIVYRVAEEALEAAGGAERLAVGTRDPGGELTVTVEGARRTIAPDRVAPIRARVELIGGTVMATESALVAVVPLGTAPRLGELGDGPTRPSREEQPLRQPRGLSTTKNVR